MTDILVRYTRNYDSNASTGALSFHDDDRPELTIGKLGYVSEEEIHKAAAYGIVLEVFTEEEAHELNLVLPVKPGADDEEAEVLSADLGQDRLIELADEEGVDLTGARSNQAKVDKIQAARDEKNAGTDSLPATATSSIGQSVGDGGVETADTIPGSSASGSSNPAGSTGGATPGAAS